MKKTLVVIITSLLIMPLTICADSYTQMWKKVKEAQKKDLPKTQIAALKDIVSKAEKEKSYGNLLKARLQMAETLCSISPDSMVAEVRRLKQEAQRYGKNDSALAAIYNTVIGTMYRDNASLSEDEQDESGSADGGNDRVKGDTIAQRYFKLALADPAMLASTQTEGYAPFIVEGTDSRYFNNDLLSVIGYEVRDYATLHDYYNKVDNRPAALFTALELLNSENEGIYHRGKVGKSRYIMQLDSLINVYKDLPECGEVACARYEAMNDCSDVTEQDEINYINWALNRWGEWKGTNALRNARSSLTRAFMSCEMSKNVITPSTVAPMKLEVRNVNTVTVKLSRLNISGSTENYPENDYLYKVLKKSIIPNTTTTQTRSFAGQPDWKTVEDSVMIGKLPVGVYMVEVSSDNQKLGTKRSLLYVTDLFVVHQKLPNGKTRVGVMNATTGQPVSQAQLTAEFTDDKLQTYTTDSKGEVTISNASRDIQRMRATTASDKAMPWAQSTNNFYYYGKETTNTEVKLYTDRSIYRPGQTIHASAIVFSRTGVTTKAIEGKEVKLMLRDANYKVLAEKTAVTNAYGVATADFTLPSSGLTGRFTLLSTAPSRCYMSLRVEEYKRPTYQIELPEITQKYQNGDTLVVIGHAKTYSGVPVQGATVSYKVRREQALWWRWNYYYASETDNDNTLAEAKTTTGSAGEFKMEIPVAIPEWENVDTELDEATYLRIARFYNIATDITITDVSGETRTAELNVPIGSKATILTCDLPEKALRDSLTTFSFGRRNMAGQDITGAITYRIDGSQQTFTAEANKEMNVEDSPLKSLKSGTHTIIAVCEGDTLTHVFTIFSLDDEMPCVKTHDWFYQQSEQFNADGKPVSIQIGSSDADVHVLYTVISGNKVIENGTFDLSNQIVKKAYIYKEEYGNGLLLNFAWVKNGVLYEHKATITRPLPNKDLNVKWVTFRDRLTPGQKEEWTLNITRPDGTAADANLMAVLYDTSLDQIVAHTWGLQLGLTQPLPYARWRGGSFSHIYMNDDENLKLLDTNGLDLSYMAYNSSLSHYIALSSIRTRDGIVTKHSNVMRAQTLTAVEEIAMPEAATFDLNAAKGSDELAEVVVTNRAKSVDEEKEAVSADNVQLRENLNETAFFYPTMQTDGKGNVSISFTLPESITTWGFFGLANDRDMNYGTLKGKAVAKKTVMIQPNVPRFVRTGDNTTVSAKVMNTSENAVKGTATLILIDPDTEREVKRLTQPFSLDANATDGVSFSFTPPADCSLLICKVIATGKGFSDGEQHYLPVLADKELVTVTVPFVQTAPSEQNISLKPLFADGSTNRRLTVEYTNNPAWLMVQALPYIGTAQNDNIISLSTAYYANSLSRNIVASTPRIKSVFEQWKREADQENGSLASSLEKNEELKTLVLSDTPWVLDAQNEAEQKRSLANFFDEAGIRNRISSLLASMKKLQNADGAWSWWPGMGSSPRLTSEVVQQMVRLNKMIGNQTDAESMKNSALKYLSKVATKEVEDIKKAEREKRPYVISDYFALQFLYINALDGRKLSQKDEAAAQYLLAYLKKHNTSNSLYAKALMAVVLAQRGETQLAHEYVKSLEEYTVVAKDKGRYYDTPRAGYSWMDYRIPTQVVAIEAMQLIDAQKYANEIAEMRQWLLCEKHTQGWNTPINSADAVYAFLNGNTNVLAEKPNTVLKVDGKMLETPDATAGLGYIKTTISNPNGKTLTAAKTSDGTSWGAVYAQSMQKTSEIAGSGSGFSVTRTIVSSDGKPLNALKVGDKVKVTITIRADRDYDFVMVKDSRAACMEPATQLSGYGWGYYCTPKDCSTNYYFDGMSKGKHVIETEYYIDRAGRYETGTCVVQCAYAPEYTAHTASSTIEVTPN